jgi:hypothetical protein
MKFFGRLEKSETETLQVFRVAHSRTVMKTARTADGVTKTARQWSPLSENSEHCRECQVVLRQAIYRINNAGTGTMWRLYEYQLWAHLRCRHSENELHKWWNLYDSQINDSYLWISHHCYQAPRNVGNITRSRRWRWDRRSPRTQGMLQLIERDAAQLSPVWGGGGAEDNTKMLRHCRCWLVGCYAMWSCRQIPICSSRTLVTTYKSTRRYNP